MLGAGGTSDGSTPQRLTKPKIKLDPMLEGRSLGITTIRFMATELCRNEGSDSVLGATASRPPLVSGELAASLLYTYIALLRTPRPHPKHDATMSIRTLAILGVSATIASAAVSKTTCNGRTFTYEEFAGYGSVHSDFQDKFGDTLSIGSSLALERASWKRKHDTYEGVVWGLPDRGW
jgi:hypothetical protein